MRLVLDGKSLVVGAFAGAALVAGLGATQDDGPQVGRYGIAGNHGEVVVFDTATRQVCAVQNPRETIPAGPIK